MFVAFLLFTPFAAAQHDPHRNAVRHVAVGQFDKAKRELKKADAQDPETHYVQMLISLGEGNVDEALEQARLALDAGLPMERLVAGPRAALQPLYQTADYQHGTRNRRHRRSSTGLC